MSWFSEFLGSSIGKKIVMSLTGLFLITFLLVHLAGNLQLLVSDGGEKFNIYTDFMSTNGFIQFVSKGLYFFILLHTVLGIALWLKNRKAKGQKYAVSTGANASFASKNMALLGTLIFAFLCIHMGDFWYKVKFAEESFRMVEYASMDHAVMDAYEKVAITFSKPLLVVIYLIGQIVLALHLWHGFQSAFQSLGINHKKYTPAIHFVGKVYAILIPLGFAIIPIYMFLNN